ncbi:hypothetical protein H8A95_24580 [Bradyrhizobium sp. Pear76]|uniref:hypothetical protein n=1 Tax=Bradyrhizobium oropedii TaxID=1571201 RepID=UPI001E554668|nr:hypothetical protein [Bradyrhizobium oropedii]MCC8965406.1 hypothetical protein [Bradyrhizobium oropedii]
MSDWIKLAPIAISVLALCISFYGAIIGPRRTTLFSERIKLSSKMLQSSNEYGWQLGSYVDVNDRASFSNSELHDPNGTVDDIIKLHNTLDADLASMQIIMPDDVQADVRACRTTLADMHHSFMKGKFSELQSKFVIYDRACKGLQGRLRLYLN